MPGKKKYVAGGTKMVLPCGEQAGGSSQSEAQGWRITQDLPEHDAEGLKQRPAEPPRGMLTAHGSRQSEQAASEWSDHTMGRYSVMKGLEPDER